MYTFQWKNPALPGKSAFTVNVASVNTAATSLTVTGKGASNYGVIQQTNILRLLENFADGTAPSNPTIGQTWYDSSNNALKVCTSVSPVVWETLGGIQITTGPAPINASVGDLWFQAGEYSGFLYVYTSTGRFPPSPWDARVGNAIPAASPLIAPYMGIKGNFSPFTVSDLHEAYIHGFTGSVAADVDGQIIYQGSPIAIGRGNLLASVPNSNGYIVWDTTGTMQSVGAPLISFFSVRSVGVGRWEYDNNSGWVPVTPATGMRVIGTLTVTGSDGTASPGITAGEIWQEALDLESFRPSASSSSSGFGGWQQIWPHVEYHGARFEYDAMMERLMNLIGSPRTWGGSDSVRAQLLADLETLDAGMVGLHNSYAPASQDTNFSPVGSSRFIAAEPTSQDWDLLLAAIKSALTRLDVPSSLISSVSPVAFTQDGRTAAPELLALPNTDVRYPPAERQAYRYYGSITGARLYAETMNALSSAIQNRYALKGIAGQNSTNVGFNPSVTTTTWATHTANYTGGTTISQFMRFYFNSSEDMDRFVYGGSAIDLQLNFSPVGVSAANTNYSSLVNTHNTWRVTADRVRIFTNALPLTLSTTPTATGILNAGTIPTYVQVGAATAGGGTADLATAIYRGTGATDPSYFAIRFSLFSAVGITGTTTLVHRVIRDAELFGIVPLFPAPNAYVAGSHDAGSSVVWV